MADRVSPDCTAYVTGLVGVGIAGGEGDGDRSASSVTPGVTEFPSGAGCQIKAMPSRTAAIMSVITKTRPHLRDRINGTSVF
jgi:hypothetical protein